MERTTALACPEHENCVALLVLETKSAQKRRGIDAPKWAQDWVHSQPDWYLRELTHEQAEETPDGLLPPFESYVVVPKTLEARLDKRMRDVEHGAKVHRGEVSGALENAEKGLRERLDFNLGALTRHMQYNRAYLETLVVELSARVEYLERKSRFRWRERKRV